MQRHETYGVLWEYTYYARLPAANGIDTLQSRLRGDISIVLLPVNGNPNCSFARITGTIDDFENIRDVVRSLGGVLLPAAPKPKESIIS